MNALLDEYTDAQVAAILIPESAASLAAHVRDGDNVKLTPWERWDRPAVRQVLWFICRLTVSLCPG
jgi:hypothetical protein